MSSFSASFVPRIRVLSVPRKKRILFVRGARRASIASIVIVSYVNAQSPCVSTEARDLMASASFSVVLPPSSPAVECVRHGRECGQIGSCTLSARRTRTSGWSPGPHLLQIDWGLALATAERERHHGGHKREDHLGAHIDNILPQHEHRAAQLARRRDGVLGVHAPPLLVGAAHHLRAVDTARLDGGEEVDEEEAVGEAVGDALVAKVADPTR
mmetsp:Transcript_15996/g.43450  ORF Transcript_15996/g.43450 Transcript_15996/m.43450 type:complete len:213 (-) Transcript_15996:553-1191(-)